MENPLNRLYLYDRDFGFSSIVSFFSGNGKIRFLYFDKRLRVDADPLIPLDVIIHETVDFLHKAHTLFIDKLDYDRIGPSSWKSFRNYISSSRVDGYDLPLE